MSYPSYLIHFNKNHSKANGQFVSGDGDGDGIANDHAHRSKTNSAEGRMEKGRKKMKTGAGLIWGSLGAAAVSGASAILGDAFDSEIAYGASIVSGLAAVGLSTIGASVYDTGRRAVKNAASEELLGAVISGDAHTAKKNLRTIQELDDN